MSLHGYLDRWSVVGGDEHQWRGVLGGIDRLAWQSVVKWWR